MTNELVDASRTASTFAVRYTTLRIARKAQTNGQFATSVSKVDEIAAEPVRDPCMSCGDERRVPAPDRCVQLRGALALVGRTVEYRDNYGQIVRAKIVKSDGWSFELDNGGALRALPRYLVD